MKQLLRLVFTVLLVACANVLFAGEKVQVKTEGHSAGTIPAMTVNDVVYVDIQRTARKLGADVEIFARSKQAKITARNFYAVLTAPLAQVVMNAQTEPLKAPVLVEGGRLMAPVDFFLMPAVGKALNRVISFKNNTLFIEKVFTLAVLETKKKEQSTALLFETKEPTAFEVHKTNRHTLLVEFDNAVLQRAEHFRLNTPFIQSATLSQQNNRALLKIILGPKAQDWGFIPTDKQNLVFEVSGTKSDFLLSGVSGKYSPSYIKKQPVLTASANNKSSGASLATVKPSVLSEAQPDEDDIEDDADWEEAVEAVNPSAAVAVDAKKPPVLTQTPPPVISGVHKKMRIVVDPGHGGKDPGATHGRYKEKDWNLAVGKELAKLLKKGGFEVKITRSSDEFIALSDRSKIANTFKADLFVSIHTNSTKNKNANGFEVYFRSDKPTDKEAAETAALENEAMQYEEVHYNFVDALLQSLAKNEYINESSKLAGHISNEIYKQEGIKIAVKKNGIRQANFYVLRGVQSPAVLVEMGYISSPKDRGRLAQSAVQKKTAKGIYNGIVSYAKKEGWVN